MTLSVAKIKALKPEKKRKKYYDETISIFLGKYIEPVLINDPFILENPVVWSLFD